MRIDVARREPSSWMGSTRDRSYLKENPTDLTDHYWTVKSWKAEKRKNQWMSQRPKISWTVTIQILQWQQFDHLRGNYAPDPLETRFGPTLPTAPGALLDQSNKSPLHLHNSRPVSETHQKQEKCKTPSVKKCLVFGNVPMSWLSPLAVQKQNSHKRS